MQAVEFERAPALHVEVVVRHRAVVRRIERAVFRLLVCRDQFGVERASCGTNDARQDDVVDLVVRELDNTPLEHLTQVDELPCEFENLTPLVMRVGFV